MIRPAVKLSASLLAFVLSAPLGMAAPQDGEQLTTTELSAAEAAAAAARAAAAKTPAEYGSVDEMLELAELEVAPVCGDGNCGYSCIAHFLSGDMVLRTTALNALNLFDNVLKRIQCFRLTPNLGSSCVFAQRKTVLLNCI